MKKLLFSAICVVSFVGASLAITNANLGQTIYCAEEPSATCPETRSGFTISPTETELKGYCNILQNGTCFDEESLVVAP